MEPIAAPDTSDGKRRIWHLLEIGGITRELIRIPAREASEEELLRVHAAAAVIERAAALTGPPGP